MKWKGITKVFLMIIGVAFLNVAIQALVNPQSVMDFVDVSLDNISAKNSIRAYYGGVNLALALFMMYGAFKMRREALLFLILYGSGFVVGRIYGILVDGLPRSFYINLVDDRICGSCCGDRFVEDRNFI